MVNTNGVQFIQDTFAAAVFDLGIKILGCLNLSRWCMNNVALWRAVLFLQCAISEDIQENQTHFLCGLAWEPHYTEDSELNATALCFLKPHLEAADMILKDGCSRKQQKLAALLEKLIK